MRTFIKLSKRPEVLGFKRDFASFDIAGFIKSRRCKRCIVIIISVKLETYSFP